MILNRSRFTNLTSNPNTSRMSRIKRCLVSCCAKVPEENDKSEADNDLLSPSDPMPPQQTTMEVPTSKDPPPYSDVMRSEYLLRQSAEILRSDPIVPSYVGDDCTPRIFFGFEWGPITPHQLEKAYWWRKYYIAKSEKLSAEEKLDRLHRADILYRELKEELVTSAKQKSPGPES